ncbi:MAG: RNA-binding protein [Bacteroidia bacterium]
MKLRVSPITAEVKKDALIELFEEYGEVDTVQILRSTRESIAIVDMIRSSEAEAAMDDLNNT